MAISHETIDKIYKTMCTHMSCRQLNALVLELVGIPGSKSFRESIERLNKLHLERKRKRYAEDDE